jgi:hypothetical protein
MRRINISGYKYTDNECNDPLFKGYLVIPEEYGNGWDIGFRSYLSDKYKAEAIHMSYSRLSETPEYMGNEITRDGYKNLKNDFTECLFSNNFYPLSEKVDYYRRLWKMLNPQL